MGLSRECHELICIKEVQRSYCNNAVPVDSGLAQGSWRGGGERLPDSGFLLKVRAYADCS